MAHEITSEESDGLIRFATALSGSSERARSAVLLFQERLGTGRQILPDATSRAVSVFRYFFREIVDPDGNLSLQDSELFERAVFLLTRMFKTPEVAQITNASIRAVQDIRSVSEDIFLRHSGAKVMIIEDEEIIALDLQMQVESLGLTVAGIATSEREAVQKTIQTRPNLLLVDIRLGEGERDAGIHAVTHIHEMLDVPSIFITAYPERLKSDLPGTHYLIVKPFLPEKVKSTITEALLSQHELSALRPPVKTSEIVFAGAAKTRFLDNPSEQPPSVSLNHSSIRSTALLAIAALEPVMAFEKRRQHNQPPPEMWIDDPVYLRELKQISLDLRALVTLLDRQSLVNTEPNESVIKLRSHTHAFLRSYATMLGKGAAIATLGLIALVLTQAGLGSELVQEVLRIAHADPN